MNNRRNVIAFAIGFCLILPVGFMIKDRLTNSLLSILISLAFIVALIFAKLGKRKDM